MQGEGLTLKVEYHLLDAAGRGNLPKAQQALAGGAPVDCTDATARTPLMLAAAEGHKDVVEWLLTQGADVNARDKRNSYALREAMLHEHFAVRDVLLRAGAVVAEADRLEMGKQLCTKAAEGNIEGVRQMLECRASANAVMYDQRSALHLSAAEGHDSIVALLLDHSADPALRDRFGGTALGDARRGNHTKSIALLRAAGAPDGVVPHLQVDEKASSPDGGATSPDGGATHRLAQTMELSDGEKLCKCAAQGDVPSLQKLVSRGVSVKTMDYDKRSALHLAAAEGHAAAVSFLVPPPPVSSLSLSLFLSVSRENFKTKNLKYGRPVAISVIMGLRNNSLYGTNIFDTRETLSTHTHVKP